MHDLNDLYFFAHVVDQGGFSAAAKKLKVPKSRLSRRIAVLEARLGARLLQRSTRRVVVTDLGQEYYQHCRAMLAEAEAAEEVVERRRAAPRGTVRVSCPISIVQRAMPTILSGFLRAHPQVTVQLHSSDRRVDVIGENFDVAIRVRSKLDTDPSLVMRQFGRSRSRLVASPEFLKLHGTPQTPDELAGLPSLSNVEADEQQAWDLVGPGGATQRVAHTPRLRCGEFAVLLQAAVDGLGIALLPELNCIEAIRRGELVVLLPDWCLPIGILHAVFPTRRGLLPAVRAFIDYVAEHLPAVYFSDAESAAR